MDQATAIERNASIKESERTHISESFTKLVWVFLLMSFVGLVGETLQHYIVFNEWESRPGFIWVLCPLFMEPQLFYSPLP